MNNVEDRLIDALRERAAHSPIDPAAWEQTLARVQPPTGARHLARVGRPARVRAWARFTVPVTAAAAVVAIVAGATVLTGRGGQHGGSGTIGTSPMSSPSVAGAPAPPGPGNYLIKGTTVVSAIIPVKLTGGQHPIWTFVWFSRQDSGSDRGLQVCMLTDGQGYDNLSGCGQPKLPAPLIPATTTMNVSAGPVASASTLIMLVSDRQVTSLKARLSSNGSVSGVSAWGRGFPYRVWLVKYPSADGAQFVFGNASGREVGHLAVSGNAPLPTRPRSGGITVFHYPAGVVDAKAGSMVAYLIDGRVDYWSSDNFTFSVSGQPALGPPAVGLSDDYEGGSKLAQFYGYAHENVSRVVLRLADGRSYSAQTFAAWKGSGLRLWGFLLPTALLPTGPSKDVVMAYNAAGHVVWQQLLAP